MTYRIYVACLAAYNNGILHGKWIDANDADKMEEETQAMLEASPIENAEEWAIHDYELGFDIGEYESFESIAERVQWIDEQYDEDLALAVLDNYNGVLEDAEKCIDEYAGEFSSYRELGEQYAHELGDVPPHLENYIDYEAYGKSWADNMIEIDNPKGGTYYFHNW